MSEMLELEKINEGVGNTRMAREKYDVYRGLILESVPSDKEGIGFSERIEAVRNKIPEEIRTTLGSVNWHVTAVKLDLEAEQQIERIPGSKPQRLRLTTVLS